MPVPLIAVARHAQPVEKIRCALVSRPTQAQQHKRAILRYFVLVIALLSVVFLMAIALYYTQGHSVTIKHVSTLTALSFDELARA